LLARQSSPPALAAPAGRGRLQEINAPTFLILGDRDVPQIRSTIETLQKGIKGSTKVVLERAGHVVNLEQPQMFNRAVLGFLQTLPR
jgi:pimeloyl-ACP methyl ester carboxylesterase